MARCLSFHASYRCRSSGACCSAGWTIPFAGDELAGVRRLELSRSAFVPLSDGGATAAVRNGACTFLEDDTRLCEIHRIGGQRLLPLTCRMFPRLILHDARGTFVTLSHFCPTAASLLFEPGPPVSIVDAPDSLIDIGPLDGLDAREVWPPLLRGGMLTDLGSYEAWEGLAVEILTRDGVTPRESLAALEAATARIAQWSPGDGPLLVDEVHAAFAALAPETTALDATDAGVKRWLAARLFGCWIAYQGRGLSTLVRYLRACLDAFVLELARDGDALQAIRRCDRLIVHEASSQRLATLLDDRP